MNISPEGGFVSKIKAVLGLGTVIPEEMSVPSAGTVTPPAETSGQPPAQVLSDREQESLNRLHDMWTPSSEPKVPISAARPVPAAAPEPMKPDA